MELDGFDSPKKQISHEKLNVGRNNRSPPDLGGPSIAPSVCPTRKDGNRSMVKHRGKDGFFRILGMPYHKETVYVEGIYI